METGPKLDCGDGYQEKIDNTRQEIREIRKSDLPNSEKKEAAREKAAILRMEVMLDQARLTKVLLQTLEDNPDITPEQFIESANSTGTVCNPEATQKFLSSLIECRDRVAKTLADAKFASDWNGPEYYLVEHPGEDADSPSDPVRLERIKNNILMSKILRNKDVQNPIGNISLGPSHPLAIEIDFDNLEDFKKVDQRDVGGFYSHEYQPRRSRRQAFPLIAVCATNGEYASARTRHHERSHSINASIRTALQPGAQPEQKWSKRFAKKIVWSDIDDDYANTFGGATSRKSMDEEEISDLALNREDRDFEQSKEFQNLLNYALSLAKDEIIAFSMSDRASETFDILSGQQGLYNYFDKMNIPSSVCQALWNSYKPIIRQATAIVERMSVIYRGFGMDERFETALFALATVPLEKWQTVCEQNLFIRELDELELVDESVRSMTSHSSTSYFHARESRRIVENVKSLFAGCGEKPLFDTLEEAAKAIGYKSIDEIHIVRRQKAA